MTAVAGLLDALARRDADWHSYDVSGDLARMLQYARTTAANGERAEDERLRAIRLLGRSEAERAATSRRWWRCWCRSRAAPCRLPRLRLWRGSTISACPCALLEGWKSHGPALRSEILDALLSRDAWAGVLLDAVEKNQVPAGDIDATRRQRLARGDDEAIKQRAAKLLAGAIESNRAQVVEQHAGVLKMEGDAQAGAAVFNKRCGVCHKLARRRT